MSFIPSFTGEQSTRVQEHDEFNGIQLCSVNNDSAGIASAPRVAAALLTQPP